MHNILAHRPVLFPCCLALALFMGGPALGFGAQGHRVIGALAEAELHPGARAAVRDILGGESLSAASTWADEMRGSSGDHPFWGYDHAANWHFVNIPEGQTYARSRKHPAGDAYAALLAFVDVLEGRPLPAGPIRAAMALHLGDPGSPANREALRAFALRFLIHLAGDLHQPMHVGYEEDRGGNDIALRWFGRPSNLHRVWDSQLLDRAGRSDREWIARLTGMADAMTSAERARLARAEPAEWLEEGLALRRDAYAVEGFGADLRQDYVQAFAPLMERQLLRAGLRLGALLNRLFE